MFKNTTKDAVTIRIKIKGVPQDLIMQSGEKKKIQVSDALGQYELCLFGIPTFGEEKVEYRCIIIQMSPEEKGKKDFFKIKKTEIKGPQGKEMITDIEGPIQQKYRNKK